jgi:6-pyruvoyltetrahydropterin/6-carboxytetrahydropterin synthase
MHAITKTIVFSYGHRLLDYAGKCRHLHGHNGLLEVDIESDTLDKRGMVMDFSEVSRLVKGWVDEHLDHKMVLCKRDPLVAVLTKVGEPLYLMDENPTAENLAQHIFEQARKLGVNTAEVRLWETPTSYARYRPS